MIGRGSQAKTKVAVSWLQSFNRKPKACASGQSIEETHAFGLRLNDWISAAQHIAASRHSPMARGAPQQAGKEGQAAQGSGQERYQLEVVCVGF